MALDYGMLTQTPGKQPVLDPAAAMQVGAQAADARVTAQSNAAAAENKKQFAQMAKEYQLAGGDLATPEGLDNALKAFNGRIDPTLYMGLVDRATKVKESAAKYKASLGQMKDDEITRQSEEVTSLAKVLGPPPKDATDPATWQKHMGEVVARAKAETLPSGERRYTDQAIAQVLPQISDPAAYTAFWNGTVWHDKELKQAKEVAEAKKLAAQADSFDRADLYLDPATGDNYRVSSTGGIYKFDKGTGDWESGSNISLPKGLTSIKGGGSNAASSLKNKQAEELVQMVKDNPAILSQWAAEYNLTGKMQSAGQNSPLRPMILAESARQAIESGRDTIGDRSVYKAESANIANLTKQYGVIKGGEQTVLGNLELMKPIIARVDASGVPALERWIRAGKRAVQGDPDVTRLDALMASTQADVGKVLSASTGAGGVPVEALKLAEKYMGGNITKEQFDALYDIVPKEMAIRTDKMEEQINHSLGKIKDMSKAYSGARSPSERVTPAAQSEADKGSVATLQSELAKVRKQYQEAKTPEEKARAAVDRDSIIREIRAKKGTVPPEDGEAIPAGGPTKKATTSGW